MREFHNTYEDFLLQAKHFQPKFFSFLKKSDFGQTFSLCAESKT